MNSTNAKTLVIVFTLIVATSLITVGCKSKSRAGLMDTNTLPGHTFASHEKSKHNSSTIVYLGDTEKKQDVDFGPKDVSFDFRNLR